MRRHILSRANVVAAGRTREALNEAISEAMYAITPEDVAGWFSHCGYELQDQYS